MSVRPSAIGPASGAGASAREITCSRARMSTSSSSTTASSAPPTTSSLPTLLMSMNVTENATQVWEELPPTFLQTTGAQAISGAFVWTALIITCHQASAGPANAWA
ncbi:hypothetical protein HPB47_023448 [Ixodes persulcatus]|uniref:Uncharacterized protein n=1 Tax=Ixodes persulcatus TaxID=34615 RepID=A0AC60Q6Y0_IXOPE|nr:hypothetical protein HPB47_023448 [Ixodes persulcatus]